MLYMNRVIKFFTVTFLCNMFKQYFLKNTIKTETLAKIQRNCS